MLGQAGPVTPGLIRVEFQSAIKAALAASNVAKIAQQVKLDAESNILEGIGAPMALKEYTGTSKFQDLAKYKTTLTSKRYQGGFPYDRDTPNDKLWPLIQPKIAQLGIGCANHAQKLLSDAIVAGTSGLAFDGLAFYSASHPIPGTVQSNLLSGAGDDTLAHFEEDFWKAIAALQGMTTDTGDPIIRNQMRVLVQCPVEHEKHFQALAKASMISSTTNVLVGTFDLWVDPNLTDDSDWYVHVLNDPAAPFVYGQFAAPEILQSEKDWNILIDAGVHHGVGYAAYQNSVKINNS